MSHRYRLYPDSDQVATLQRHCADARFVWNLALEQANLYRSDHGPTPNRAEFSRWPCVTSTKPCATGGAPPTSVRPGG
jgi:hypothetical protein